jgi:predicted nuclease with TOPRIM domain
MPAETSEKPSRTPTEVLKAARQRDSADKRGRVLKAVQDMLRDNRRVTFAAVAREADVSSWLVYAPGLRERIDQARARQAAQDHQDQRSGRRVSTSSEQTDLLLARQEIKRLRTENGQLRQQARVHLGQQVEQLGNHDLVDRVNELTEENLRLSTAERQATTENTQLRQRVTELENDLAAARTSLRRMIRDQSR